MTKSKINLKNELRQTGVSASRIAVGVIALVIIGVAAIYFSGVANSTSSPAQSNSVSQTSSEHTTASLQSSTTQLSSTTQASRSTTTTSTTILVVGGLVTVHAGGYTPYQFAVPNGTTNARVVGNFSVQGGNANIVVVIVDQTNYATFQNPVPGSHQVVKIYDSGQVAASGINQALPPGTYYLVFTNRFDSANAKAVSAQINLVYSGK